MQDTKFQKFVIFINSLVPLAFMTFDWFRGNLGANPIEYVTRTTGILTLLFLLITLLVTPLRKIFNWTWLVKQRRTLGLFAFFYGSLHLITYLVFDRGFGLLTVPGDIWQRPFIAVGMLSFFLMVPLAVTSTNGMIKRLGGKNWQKLHKLIYPIAIGGVFHYYLIVKSDITFPLGFGIVLAILLGYRYYTNQKQTPNKILSVSK